MIKTLICALFLSQSLIADIQVFHEPVKLTEYEYDPSYTRRVDTFHIHSTYDRAVVVAEDTWYTQKAPIPYQFFWECPFVGQTAQQCVAIFSFLVQEFESIDQSPIGQEIEALKKRIEEKARRRNQPRP